MTNGRENKLHNINMDACGCYCYAYHMRHYIMSYMIGSVKISETEETTFNVLLHTHRHTGL